MVDRMFPFINCKPFNPIGGVCAYNCYKSKCWAKQLIERYGYPKYQGQARLIESMLKKKYGTGDFAFFSDMNDAFANYVPKQILQPCIEYMNKSPAKFLCLDKNPERYLDFSDQFTPNMYLGATIETDLSLPNVSQAPDVGNRIAAMQVLSEVCSNSRFVCAEPILMFSPRFAEEIKRIEPWGVAIGYDNYGLGLNEPLLAFTYKLIQELEDAKIKVYRKSLHPSNREHCFGRGAPYSHCAICDLQAKCKGGKT